MATQVVQLTGNAAALPMNSLDYTTWSSSLLFANANTFANTVGLPATNANATQVIIADFDPKNRQDQMQWKQNTRHWFTEFETKYGEAYRNKGQKYPQIAYDRKVPGGGADPGSGKIVQLEVPTTPGQPNHVADMLPFPSVRVA